MRASCVAIRHRSCGCQPSARGRLAPALRPKPRWRCRGGAGSLAFPGDVGEGGAEGACSAGQDSQEDDRRRSMSATEQITELELEHPGGRLRLTVPTEVAVGELIG